VKTIESDPEFDTKKAKKKLRRYVEGHEHAIKVKAEIMVDHFHEQVIDLQKIGGEARAMVVTGGVNRPRLWRLDMFPVLHFPWSLMGDRRVFSICVARLSGLRRRLPARPVCRNRCQPSPTHD
jgi:hypothetical protein